VSWIPPSLSTCEALIPNAACPPSFGPSYSLMLNLRLFSLFQVFTNANSVSPSNIFFYPSPLTKLHRLICGTIAGNRHQMVFAFPHLVLRFSLTERKRLCQLSAYKSSPRLGFFSRPIGPPRRDTLFICFQFCSLKGNGPEHLEPSATLPALPGRPPPLPSDGHHSPRPG